MFCFLGLLVFLLFPSVSFSSSSSSSSSSFSCALLVERAIKPYKKGKFPFALRLKAKAGVDTEGEASGVGVTSGVWVIGEIPLYSKAEMVEEELKLLRIKREIFLSIARLRASIRKLKLLRDLKRYRRERADRGFESYERYLRLLEEEEEAKREYEEALMRLKLYNISKEEALKCAF